MSRYTFDRRQLSKKKRRRWCDDLRNGVIYGESVRFGKANTLTLFTIGDLIYGFNLTSPQVADLIQNGFIDA